MQNNFNNLEILDILSVISFFLSYLNYEENLKQTSNNELFKELQKQDDIMSNQIIERINNVEKQNGEILKLLRKGDK